MKPGKVEGHGETMMAGFLETTWYVWWLFAAIVIGRWCFTTFVKRRRAMQHQSPSWRKLYRMALLEGDNSKVAFRIEEAERAILLELAAQLFGETKRERRALQDAMNNLRRLRLTLSGTPEDVQVAS